MDNSVQRQLLAYLKTLTIGLCFLFAGTVAKAQPPMAGFDVLGTYNGHAYYISQAYYFGKDIHVAVADAQSKSAAPASQVYAAAIVNGAENAFITNAVLAYNAAKFGDNGKSTFDNWTNPKNPWIGLSDDAQEGNFVWLNGQASCENYRNWNEGEPNNFALGENFTQLLIMNPYLLNGDPNHDPLGKWNDWFNQYYANDGVTETKLPVIIEVGLADCLPFTVSLTGTTNVTCYGNDNGSASFTITPGVAPYTYKLDGGDESAPVSTTSFTIIDLEDGPHAVLIKDAAGSSKNITFTITQPSAPLEAQSSAVTNVACNGSSTGSVTITATGGTAPYTGTGLQTGLTAGPHTFTVTDKNGCSDDVVVTIIEPTKLILTADKQAACNGGSGSVTISATGGTAPYTGTGLKTGLAAGNYTYTVTDASGCSATIAVTIEGSVGGFNVLPENFPTQFNTGFTKSLSNKTFVGSTGTWTVNTNSAASVAVLQPYYSPSSTYALKVLNFKTQYCDAGWSKSVSPRLNLTGPCCPNEVKLNFTLWTYAVTSGDTKAALEFDFSNDNGATWTEVWSKTSAQLFTAYGANGKTSVSIPVSTEYQNANFRYRVRGEMAAGDCNNFYVFIDDVTVTSPAVCTPVGSIGDFVWNDLNGNGVQDSNEPGLPNVAVKLTLPNGTTQTKTTSVAGAYSFTGLTAGNYTVTFTTPVGFVATAGNVGDDTKDSDPVNGVATVTLAAGQNTTSVDAGFMLPVCTNTTNHTETFPNWFNPWFIRSLYNQTFTGSAGVWTVNSNAYATMTVIKPYYAASSSYALKVVNFKTTNCGAGWTKAVSPKIDLSAPCCPADLKMSFTLWTYKVVANDAKAKLAIDFSNNNGATWTEVWVKTSAQLYSSYGCYGKPTITIPVTTAFQNPNFRYRVRGEMAAGDCNNFYVFIDDVKIGSPATCGSASPGSRMMGSETTQTKTEAETLPTAMRSEIRKPLLLVEAPDKAAATEFSVRVFPNPSSADFALAFTSKEADGATIRVIDMFGRTVRMMKLTSNSTVRFGADLKAGSYIVEVVQGQKREVTKLIKF